MVKNKPVKTDPSNELIVQHNHLIEAKYHLTLQEKRLMCWLSSQVQKDDEDFKEHELSIKDFAQLVDVKGDHLYKTLDAVTHKLMQKIITIKLLNERGFTKAALLGGAKYYVKKGLIKLSFHPYLKPYMLQLRERFTTVSLWDVLGLRSVHAIRVYELLKQYEALGKRRLLLGDLREYCGIKVDQYKRINDFKKDVVIRAVQEINSKTDIFVEFEEIKTARKITAINFLIKPNTGYENLQKKSLPEDTPLLAMFNEITQSKLKLSMAKEQELLWILKQHPGDPLANWRLALTNAVADGFYSGKVPMQRGDKPGNGFKLTPQYVAKNLQAFLALFKPQDTKLVPVNFDACTIPKMVEFCKVHVGILRRDLIDYLLQVTIFDKTLTTVTLSFAGQFYRDRCDIPEVNDCLKQFFGVPNVGLAIS